MPKVAAVLGWLVQEQGIEPHIPVFDKSARKDGTFSREDFTYDLEGEVYRCPGSRCGHDWSHRERLNLRIVAIDQGRCSASGPGSSNVILCQERLVGALQMHDASHGNRVRPPAPRSLALGQQYPLCSLKQRWHRNGFCSGPVRLVGG